MADIPTLLDEMMKKSRAKKQHEQTEIVLFVKTDLPSFLLWAPEEHRWGKIILSFLIYERETDLTVSNMDIPSHAVFSGVLLTMVYINLNFI